VKKRLLVIGVVLIVLVATFYYYYTTVHVGTVKQNNIIKNGSFEDKSAWCLYDIAWSEAPENGFVLDPNGYSGKCLKIINSAVSPDRPYLYQDVSLPSGTVTKPLYFSFKYKPQNPSASFAIDIEIGWITYGLWILLSSRGAEITRGTGEVFGVTDVGGGWKQVEVAFLIGAGNYPFRINPLSVWEQEYVYLDDLYLGTEDPPSAENNLLTNGDFETGTYEGWKGYYFGEFTLNSTPVSYDKFSGKYAGELNTNVWIIFQKLNLSTMNSVYFRARFKILPSETVENSINPSCTNPPFALELRDSVDRCVFWFFYNNPMENVPAGEFSLLCLYKTYYTFEIVSTKKYTNGWRECIAKINSSIDCYDNYAFYVEFWNAEYFPSDTKILVDDLYVGYEPPSSAPPSWLDLLYENWWIPSLAVLCVLIIAVSAKLRKKRKV